MGYEMFENTVEKFGKNVGLIHVSISSVLTIVFLISIPLHIAFNFDDGDDLDVWEEIVTVAVLILETFVSVLYVIFSCQFLRSIREREPKLAKIFVAVLCVVSTNYFIAFVYIPDDRMNVTVIDSNDLKLSIIIVAALLLCFQIFSIVVAYLVYEGLKRESKDETQSTV